MKKLQPSLKLGFTLVAVFAVTLAALVRTPVRGKSSANALPPAAGVSVVVTIHIGKPSTCTGFGICKITLGGALSRKAVNATFGVRDDGKLSLSIEGKVPDEEITCADFSIFPTSAPPAAPSRWFCWD
jgi:hypothetical protein